MQHSSQLPPSSFSEILPHLTANGEQHHQPIHQQTIGSFVAEIPHSLNLTVAQREQSHDMATFHSTLPQEISLQNYIYAQASMQNTIASMQHTIANMQQDFAIMKKKVALYQLQDSNPVITSLQRATMQAAVKEHLVQINRIQWDVAPEVMDYLKVNQIRIGFEPVFANPKMSKDLQKETKKFATDSRNFLRKIIRNSLGMTQGKPELKVCLTKTVDEIAGRFLEIPVARASPEFFAFVALLRYIARETPTLINRGRLARPQKGTDWWTGVAAWFQNKIELWGNNKNMGEWLNLIQIIIADERKLHPEDPIPFLPPSIPVNQGVPPPSTPASTEYMESSPIDIMDHVDHAPDASHTTRYSRSQYIQEGQASGSSSTQSQHPDPHISGPYQPTIYSLDIPYRNSYYSWTTSDDQIYERL
ncbi:hypothetical protein M422DRAFT_246172 [Sphaerobolus stellatus SS14]|nr:hypothetical protein M422DRAFT_246172 [Sphaerobolus stellatus SS14]